MSGTLHKPSPRIARRVLVIDDEPRMAASLKELLEAHAFAVEVAGSGNEGLAKLEEWEAPVVITDLRMANGDGVSVMDALAARPSSAFIVITGHASTESAIEALKHRAFDYVTKPFDFDVLLSAVTRAFASLEEERFRDDMISMITHDVKIPLTSILGYSGMIFNRQSGEPHARAREFVTTIRSNGQKILSLLDNFLTTCKIDAGRLTLYFRDVNIHSLIEDSVGMLWGDLERHNVIVEQRLDAEPPVIKADESLVSRAIGNVLSNACKFTPPAGRISIETDLLPRDRSPLAVPTFSLRVSNTGPGIPPEELELILEKYQRSSSQQGIEGSGIGSYVLRYVVEAHGGKVLVASRPNELTSFTLLLPVEQVSTSKESFSS